MNTFRRLAAMAPMLTLVGAAPLSAQAVQGLLVERANGVPLGGAFVALLDQSGKEVARGLTTVSGTFLLKAPAAGTYRLQSKRIGFRLSESPPLALADSQTMEYRLEVEAIPVRLPSVVVEGRPQCGSRGEEGTVVAQLWEEAREALAEVEWTAGQRTLEYRVARFQRDFGPGGNRVEKDSTWIEQGTADTPFRAAPVEDLIRDGYVVGDDRKGRTYYAPDAPVLLSDAFSNSHCFVPRGGEGGNAGMVGLVFTPAPNRRLPDVRGALWVDRETAELRFLEYRYANVPPDLPEGAIGGRVEFARISTGAWIVMRWTIRMPVMARAVDVTGRRQPEAKVMGFRDAGGEVLEIRSHTGMMVFSAQSAILEGTVVDSTRGGAPLARARVALMGTSSSAFTDSSGRFQIAAPLDGDYRAAFAHPRVDSLGGQLDPTPVSLVRGARGTATLAIPPESRLVERLCPGRLRPGERVIVGTVRGPERSLADSAEVRLSWQEVGGGAGGLRAGEWHLSTVTDSAGRYVLCGVPPLRVTLAAGAQGLRSPEVVLSFSRDGIWIDEARFRSFPGLIWTQDLTLRR